MKKMKKRALIAGILSVMMLGMNTQAMAATEMSENGTSVIDITKSVSSEFSVLIPKRINLGEETEVTFQVQAKGNIAPTETLVVTTDETVDMNRVGEEAYDAQDANVTLSDCSWNYETLLSEYTEKSGKVVFEETKAGQYYGVGMFYIQLSGGPELVEGDGVSYSLMVTPDVIFRTSAEFDEVQEIQVDGEVVSSDYYTTSENDTVVQLSGEYLTTLEAREHQISIVSKSGITEGTFTAYEGIPEGCSYTVNATGEVLGEGESIPNTPAQGDIFKMTDYEFHYLQMMGEDGQWKSITEEELEYVAAQYVQEDTDECFGKWFFAVVDNSKESYEKIPSVLFGESNKNLSSVFANCTNLKYAPIIPSAAKNMIGTFYNCTSLLEVPNLPSDIFPYRTFEKCTSLTDVVLSDGLKRIGVQMFYDCSNLKSIVLPESVELIEENAFAKCIGLSSIYIPSSVTTIKAARITEGVFYQCDENLKIYCSADNAQEGWGSYWNYCNSSKALEVTYGITRNDYEKM